MERNSRAKIKVGWGGGADKQLFEVKASVEVGSQLFCNMLMKGGGGENHCTLFPLCWPFLTELYQSLNSMNWMWEIEYGVD